MIISRLKIVVVVVAAAAAAAAAAAVAVVIIIVVTWAKPNAKTRACRGVAEPADLSRAWHLLWELLQQATSWCFVGNKGI